MLERFLGEMQKCEELLQLLPQQNIFNFWFYKWCSVHNIVLHCRSALVSLVEYVGHGIFKPLTVALFLQLMVNRTANFSTVFNQNQM